MVFRTVFCRNFPGVGSTKNGTRTLSSNSTPTDRTRWRTCSARRPVVALRSSTGPYVIDKHLLVGQPPDHLGCETIASNHAALVPNAEPERPLTRRPH